MNGMSPPWTSPKPTEAGKRCARLLRQHIVHCPLERHSLPLNSISCPHRPLVKKKKKGKKKEKGEEVETQVHHAQQAEVSVKTLVARYTSSQPDAPQHLISLHQNNTYCGLFCPNVSHEDMQNPTNTPRKMLSRIYPL